MTAVIDAPQARAAAVAASALRAICRPGTASATCTTPAGATISSSLPPAAGVHCALTSAVRSSANVTTRAPAACAAACHSSACASSALMMAMPPRGQRRNGVRMLGSHFGHTRHELLVLALRVVDDHDRRPRECGQFPRLAAMVHAYLDDGGTMHRAQAQQGQRYADRVVEGCPLGLAPVRARGLPRPFPSPSSCHCCRRWPPPGNVNCARQYAASWPSATSGSSWPSATSGSVTATSAPSSAGARSCATSAATAPCARGGRHEVVAVEVLALQRDEEIARAQRAAVRRHPLEAHVAADEAAFQDAGSSCRIHHALPHIASAVAATAASANGVRTRSRSW